jgi:NADPH-dependent 2,4-dienoyl-CoA reductase/sulfur reductase-like enzyme
VRLAGERLEELRTRRKEIQGSDFSDILGRQEAAQTIRTVPEPNKTVKVVCERDVVVVGGGPGGIGAAVAATRSGANTVLIQRYGHIGGMGTVKN